MEQRRTLMGEALRRFTASEASTVLARISDFLDRQAIRGYVVGGLVRDMLLARDTADIDLAIVADALEIARALAAALDGHYVPLDPENRIGRVVLDPERVPFVRAVWEVDLSTIAGSIENDLRQRDFTVDAMAIDLRQLREGAADLQLIDPLDGWDDLRQGVIRAVSDGAFAADAARLLRAARLAAELGFVIDRNTEGLIQRNSRLIGSVAGERVREELLRLLALPGAAESLSCLDRLGILTVILPELVATRGVEQPKEHHWDVFEHLLKTVEATGFLLRERNWEYYGNEALAHAPWSPGLARHFDAEVSHGSRRRSLLKLAALLHDVAKPQTKAVIDKRVRFLGHAQEGAGIAAGILARLRFSAKEVKLVETEIRYHLRPTQMSQDGMPSRRAIYRYFRDAGDAGVDILFLSLADHLATRGPDLNLTYWQQHAEMVKYVLDRHFEQRAVTPLPKLLDGHDLISIFGLSPGPRLGALLETIREAQAAGELTTRQEALAYVERMLKG